MLLLDEPVGSLDGPLRQRLLADLDALFDRLGLTVAYVTHDVAEAFALGDSVAVLRDGTVVQQAAPEALGSAGRRLDGGLPRPRQHPGRDDPARGGSCRARARGGVAPSPGSAPPFGCASGSSRGKSSTR